MQGQNRGVRLETPPGPPDCMVGAFGYKAGSRNSEESLDGESEGVIRAKKGGNAPGAKDPCFSNDFFWRRHCVIAQKAQSTPKERVRVLSEKALPCGQGSTASRAVKAIGKPDDREGPVRFDEGAVETG